MAVFLRLQGSIEDGGLDAIVRPSLLPETQRLVDITSLDRVMVLDEGSAVHASIAAATEAVVIRDVTEVTHFILTGGGSADFKLAFTLCLLYTSPSPRDRQKSRMPSSA